MGLFIIVKRKGTKRWLGAIPARKGISLKKLRLLARAQVKPGFTFRIINTAQLKRLLLRLGRRGIGKLRIGKARRRKRVKKRKRAKKKR